VREMVFPIVHGRLIDREARDGVMLPAVAGGVPIVWTAIPELQEDPGTGITGAPVPANSITFSPAAPDGSGNRSVNLADVVDSSIVFPPMVESRVAQLVVEATTARDDVASYVDFINNVISPQIGGYQQAAEQAAIDAAASAQQSADMIPPATNTVFGKIKLAGDLAGTASAPTVPALAQKADLVGGKIPQAQLPAIAMVDFLGNVNSQSAMLALNGQRGDWCNRTDLGTEWQLIAEPSTSLSSWAQKIYPASPVSSVAGRTGAVTISSTDVTDATAVGRNVMKAVDAAAARSAIGAGTSNLTLGTTSTTALAGDRAPQLVSSLPGSPIVGVLYCIPG
ncbi:hypothetical protein, partial [Prescottella equi]|uniref:hypothetical protein n=1 Tax=Rhodococcus hoagii TaxID=43767 RepID=UPI0021D5009D